MEFSICIFRQHFIFLFGILVLSLLVLGCSGVQTYPGVARAGDTVSIAAGWKHGFSRDNITVTITDADANTIVYLPGDPAIRAVINMYPDPVSSILVSEETNQDLTPYAQTYSAVVNTNVTNDDKDWWETSVFLDLPSVLALGSASIDISSIAGESASALLEIIGGTGGAESFQTEFGTLNINQLASMERVSHYVVSFNGSTIPYGIQVEFSHLPDSSNGGTGIAYVVNPRGDLKNVSWSDDGNNLKVLIVPSRTKYLSTMNDFKFYVAGGITGLIVTNVQAVDNTGNPITGVAASLVLRN